MTDQPDKVQLIEILPIVCYNAPILRQVATPAEDTEETQNLIGSMLLTMHEIGTAVGLAANQVNSSLSVFVMNPTRRKDIVVINPILLKSRHVVKSPESCLSLPGIHETIDRYNTIEVEFFDRNFNKQRMKLKGFEAIVWQHEYCHLKGELFIDKLEQEGRDKIQSRLSDIENRKVETSYHIL